MTSRSHRLSRIMRIRAGQKLAAQSKLAQIEAEQARIANTIDRIGGFRKEFALEAGSSEGHRIRAVGEFGLRLDGVEDVLRAKGDAADVDRHKARTKAIAAWQHHRGAGIQHDRAMQMDGIAQERAESAQFLPRLQRQRGGRG